MSRGSPKTKCWLWSCLAANTARMRILPTQDADSAAELLDGLGRNGPVILMCDRYSAFKAFARLFLDKAILVSCWAQVLRDWVRTAPGQPELEAWVAKWPECCLSHYLDGIRVFFLRLFDFHTTGLKPPTLSRSASSRAMGGWAGLDCGDGVVPDQYACEV